MQVKLRSDFLDYYDHQFDRDGIVFERLSQSGMQRSEMLTYLSTLFTVPVHGPARELSAHLHRSSLVVVYLDEIAHCGEGKCLMTLSQAEQDHPDQLAAQYIPHHPGRSLRYLQVGHKRYWLEYTSLDDWRSNCGDGGCRVLSEGEGYHQSIHQPLFAVDFVQGDRLYAIDYNIAPGVRHSGVETLLSATDAVASIKAAITHFEKGR